VKKETKVYPVRLGGQIGDKKRMKWLDRHKRLGYGGVVNAIRELIDMAILKAMTREVK